MDLHPNGSGAHGKGLTLAGDQKAPDGGVTPSRRWKTADILWQCELF